MHLLVFRKQLVLDDVSTAYFKSATYYASDCKKKKAGGFSISLPKVPKLPKSSKPNEPVDEYCEVESIAQMPFKPQAIEPEYTALQADEEQENPAIKEKRENSSNKKIKLRSNFNPLAHFTGSILTDKQGKVSIPIQISESLTRFKIFAVASSISNMNQYGKGESTLTTRLPLALRSTAPSFLYFNDEAAISVIVENLTEQHKTVHLGLICKTNNVAVLTNKHEQVPHFGYSVEVAGNRSHWFTFFVKALQPGNCKLEVLCASGHFGDGELIEFPIHTINTTDSTISGMIHEENTLIKSHFVPPQDSLGNFGELNLQFSSKRVTNLFSVVRIMLQSNLYSHEQHASLLIVLGSLFDVIAPFFNHPDLCSLYFNKFYNVSSIIQANRNYVKNISCFSHLHYYLQIYLFLSLAATKRAASFLDLSFSALKRHITTFTKITSHQKRFFFACFALWYAKPSQSARRGVVHYLQTHYLHEIPIQCLAWALPILSDNHTLSTNQALSHIISELRENIINFIAANFYSFIEKDQFVLFYLDEDGDYLDSPTRLVSIVLYGILSVSPINFMVNPLVDMLLARMENGQWAHFHENAWAVLALQAYFHHYDRNESISAFSWVNGNFCGEFLFDENKFAQKLSVPLEYLLKNRHENHPNKNEIILFKKGKSSLFYQLEVKFASNKLIIPAKGNGIKIERSYASHLSNSEEQTVQLENETVKVSKSACVLVTLSVHVEHAVNGLVVVDYLPAGFTPENPLIKKLPPARKQMENEFELDVKREATFDLLPPEIISHIFSYLSLSQLANAERVCQYWRRLATDSSIWNKFFRQLEYVNYNLQEWWMSSKDFYLLSTGRISKDFCRSNYESRKSTIIAGDWFSYQIIRTERVECFASTLGPGSTPTSTSLEPLVPVSLLLHLQRPSCCTIPTSPRILTLYLLSFPIKFNNYFFPLEK